MVNANSITPFPTDIDRLYFGSWLSGFTDGEGCFCLFYNTDPRYRSKTPVATFHIKLRKDDTSALLLVQSYLLCGSIQHGKARPPSKPQTTFFVSKISDHINTIIPHFERFPLLAKKREDFALWRRGVELIHTVTQRPHRFLNDPSCSFGGGKRHISRWTEEDYNKFNDIQDALHEQREYRD